MRDNSDKLTFMCMCLSDCCEMNFSHISISTVGKIFLRLRNAYPDFVAWFINDG